MFEIVRKQVKILSFMLLNPEVIKKISTAKIVTPELYDVDGYPVDGGLMDLRLGAIDPGTRCRTCGGTLKECLGHPGSIELARPVIHVHYVPLIEKLLKSFCHTCGKILLKETDEKKYHGLARLKKAQNTKKCPYCNAEQEKMKIEKPTTFYSGKKRVFPSEVREILERISNEELKELGFDPATFRPEWALLTLLLVPPVTIRPSITLESGERSEDGTTHKMSDIIRANQRLWENLNAGAPEVIIEDLWDLLQYHVTTFFDNTIARIPPARHRSGQPLKTIAERIKGKEGRIRHNLAGKRVNFSSRSVISPDPKIELNEVGVPLEIAKILTVAERVTSLNIEKLKKLILSEAYPGANYIIRPDRKRKKVTPDLKQEIIDELQPGYIVERHLQDGDVVLFNRHPSLHRPSLMAHYVKVLPYKTFRMHPAIVTPYNADFDGDEMNIHSPQTEEARAEAKVLLEINKNLMSMKDNSNLFGLINDAITGNYLLSKKELSKEEADQLLFESFIEPKINKKKIQGLEAISLCLPKLSCKIKKARSEIHIEGGKIVEGNIDKSAFGAESGEIIKEVDKAFDRKTTIDVIKKAFALGTTYLTRNGFSISVSDFKVNEKVKNSTKEIIKGAEERTKEITESYYGETLELIPGQTREESREIKILQALNEIKTKIGRIVKEEFPTENPVNSMIASRSRGNILNISQIACSVGQQALWSKRISLGYKNRTLSCFREHDLSPKAHGFIYSSYLDGLEPCEFFFGSMTGRDALMDTALRTPKSGYLYRRLANALQDLKTEYDGTVRDASENIVQYKFGADGIDVSELHKNGKLQAGEAIGIVASQAFGEPSTQMALNVFHFAGVQEMQITLGLPRLIEIFDARKTPSTPITEVYLEKDYSNEKDAQALAEKIKETKLKELVSEIKIDFTNKKLEVILNDKALKKLKLSADKVAERLKEGRVKDNSVIISSQKYDVKTLYKLKERLKDTIISGIKGIRQSLVIKREKEYIIMTHGSNLEEIFKVKGVDKDKTRTNNIYEVAAVLGIEAARQSIIEEVKKVLNQQGLEVNERYISLVADAMTSTGEIKGVTRMGIISEKKSILARASFETPIKHFVNATIKGVKDELASVIENIILNQPVPVGTGLPGLLVKVVGPLTKEIKEPKSQETEKGKKKE